ncbi:small ribosomal subunit protein mS39-like isoform X2 [Artemia franciscana]|uniref:small ribosomal subunit protein mS39-like isoform X2 n=1 Tax=Artemia franciscana TaxID=6661 RepID=UPI0032DB70D7
MQRKSFTVLRQLSCYKANRSPVTEGNAASSSIDDSKMIQIPTRIERGPTDILKALAKTVKRDKTAAHYKFQDDPYLIPLTVMGKRQFALSKEAGRKAAKWIRQEHAEFFQHKLADPFIEAFAPTPKYDENSEVSNEILRTVIERQDVSNAINVFELMKTKNIDVHPATEQSLLELLCFHNSEDPLDMDDAQQLWYFKAQSISEKSRNNWRDSGYAEKLFHSMKNKTPEAYCAMIQGMASYGQGSRAWNLYNEMRENKLTISTEAYNSIISVVPILKEEANLRWELLEEVLRNMVEDGVAPNLGTLNAILSALSKVSLFRISLSRSLSALTEFRSLGIEPCLASFYHLLNIHYARRVSGSTLLPEIVQYLEGLTEINPGDMNDVNFFFKAMEICHEKHADLPLAHRIHSLLIKHGGGKFIGGALRESIYYRYYFQLVAKTETIDNLMEFYHSFVPHIYNPELSVMEDIITSIDIHGAIEHIPQIWSDARLYEKTQREKLAYQILSSLAKNVKPVTESVTESENEMRQRILKTATDIWNNLESMFNAENQRSPSNWSGEPLGNLLMIFLRLDGFQRACKVIEKLDRDGATKVSGFPKGEALRAFLGVCKDNAHASHALATINYVTQIGYEEAEELATFVAKNIPMDEAQRNKLNAITGKDLFSE